MIVITDVSKSYPLQGFARYRVFHGLTVTLPSRKNIGIIGRNGAGKSTLLRLIGGIELPDSGSIKSTCSISPPVGLASGFAHQITGRDNARFVCRINGDKGATLSQRVDFVEDFAELGEFFERPVSTYSSGMRARLAFAISMSFEHDYYLIDELMSVGDKRFREKAELTFAKKRGEASIVMVSHNLGNLKRDCDCGLYLNENGITFFDSISDAVEQYESDQEKIKSKAS
ncbi:ABC transporter ATP-binding protein [Algiphilus sp.]|uniref:ABC transporter ATP-binding protein n=1 Tax=Algiphilus sp. TaxID=1872431 RepID=UPI0032EFCA34